MIWTTKIARFWQTIKKHIKPVSNPFAKMKSMNGNGLVIEAYTLVGFPNYVMQ